ncbi:MAG: tol-pal system protein YbgF [Endomicrobiales bacterium]|nr:tol-pal system protein YbgF [Endomicrobiales bacterium]
MNIYSRCLCLPALLLVLAGFSGCIATSSEMSGLRDDIYELQLKLNELQSNQADLSSKMDTMMSKMDLLSSDLEETRNRMSLLGQRLDDVESNISQRVNKLSQHLSGSSISVPPPPSEVYRMAYSDFSRGKFELAITGFRSYLEKYPQGEMAPQSRYYIGESYYAQDDWQKAAEEFDLVEKEYPKIGSVASARFKKALCLEQSGKKEEAKDLFESLLKDYPNSPEAFSAKDKLKITDGK